MSPVHQAFNSLLKKEQRHLFSLQRELNKNLLQLLVHKVDAKLLKTILLKNKKVKVNQESESWIIISAGTI